MLNSRLPELRFYVAFMAQERVLLEFKSYKMVKLLIVISAHVVNMVKEMVQLTTEPNFFPTHLYANARCHCSTNEIN